MSPRAFSAVILRLIGMWFLIEAAFGLVGIFFFHRALMTGAAGVHRRWYDGAPQPLAYPADTYLHDTYYVVSQFAPDLVGTGLRLTAGLVLLLGSRPLARLLSRNLDTI